ncbi:hypothetical protein J0S82_008053, partial [Galemys pyrenaicus]
MMRKTEITCMLSTPAPSTGVNFQDEETGCGDLALWFLHENTTRWCPAGQRHSCHHKPGELRASVQTLPVQKPQHTQSVPEMVQKWNQETPVTKMRICYVLEEDVLYQEAQEGLRKMWVSNGNKAMNMHAEALDALVKQSPRRSRPTPQRGIDTSSVDLPTSFTPSSGNVLTPTSPHHPHHQGSQTLLAKGQGRGCGYSPSSQRYSGYHRSTGPHKSSRTEN